MLSHNFDVNNQYSGYYDDWAHAWASFLVPYAQHYYRGGRVQWYSGHTLRASPDGVLGEVLDNSGAAWDALGAQASWEKCVREGTGCDSDEVGANDRMGGFARKGKSVKNTG